MNTDMYDFGTFVVTEMYRFSRVIFPDINDIII